MVRNSQTVLVTGATDGIGRQLAAEFARQGHPLILTARFSGELMTFADGLAQTFRVPVHTVVRDLEVPGAAHDLLDELAERELHPDILVHNPVLAFRGNFHDHSVIQDINMLRMNIGLAVRLANVFRAGMVQRGAGRILNAATVTGAPDPAVRRAAAIFVLTLHETLARELKSSPVTVTALTPDDGAGMAAAAAAYESLMRGDARVRINGSGPKSRPAATNAGKPVSAFFPPANRRRMPDGRLICV